MNFCSECVCNGCLHYHNNAGTCPYGLCYDDARAKVNPYDAAHPGQPPRKAWSNWNLPGEQAHWCRGGVFYTAQACDYYVKYNPERTRVESCLLCSVQVYQDGSVRCGLVDCLGCEECYQRWLEQNETD